MKLKNVVPMETVASFLEMPFAWQEAARDELDVRIVMDVVGIPDEDAFCVSCFRDYEHDQSPTILPIVNLFVTDDETGIAVEASCGTRECADCGSDHLYSDWRDYDDDMRDAAMIHRDEIRREK